MDKIAERLNLLPHGEYITTYIYGRDAFTSVRVPHYHVLADRLADGTGTTRCGKRLEILLMMQHRKPADDHLCAACARTMNGDDTARESDG